MKIAVIIPTYNEKNNIGKIIQEIFKLNISNLEILVVDDNSPDGTGQLVEALKAQDSRVHIIHRQRKEGLGLAYITGFKYALSHGYDYIFEMDADFSHDPKEIPNFLKAIQQADLVLGARYIPGGDMRIEPLRRFTSQLGNFYSKLILDTTLHDLTTGYRCYSRRALEGLDLEKIDSTSYVFQIETAYKVFKKGFKVKEIPIIFTERIAGRSKFQWRMMLETFWLLIKFRLFWKA